MNYKDYIKNNKLIIPKGFNSELYCSSNNLTELILPEGFNSDLSCHHNKLTELILPEGFNSYLVCDNPDIYKIAKCMKEFNLNYFNAGIKIIDKLNLNKLTKLKLNIILNEL